MTHTYYNPAIAKAAQAVRDALETTRAPHIPFAATNALHRAIAALDDADTECREADAE